MPPKGNRRYSDAGNGPSARVHSADLHSAFPAAQPDTLSCEVPTGSIFAVTRMFLSGMNNLPRQVPFLSCWRPVRSCVPTSWSVALRESCFALALAQATVPHSELPQGAMSMMLFPPGLFQRPSIDAVLVEAWIAKAAMRMNAGIIPSCESD